MHDRIHVVIDWSAATFRSNVAMKWIVANVAVKWNICSKTGEFSQFLPENGRSVSNANRQPGEWLRCISATLQCFAWNVYAKHSSAFSFTNTAHATLKQLHCWWPCRKRAEICPKWLSVPDTFFCTGRFFSSYATILKLVWDPRKWTYWISKSFILTKTNTTSPQQKRGAAHSKDTEKANITPVALIGGRLEIKIVSCLKLVVLRSTEVS